MLVISTCIRETVTFVVFTAHGWIRIFPFNSYPLLCQITTPIELCYKMLYSSSEKCRRSAIRFFVRVFLTFIRLYAVNLSHTGRPWWNVEPPTTQVSILDISIYPRNSIDSIYLTPSPNVNGSRLWVVDWGLSFCGQYDCFTHCKDKAGAGSLKMTQACSTRSTTAGNHGFYCYTVQLKCIAC